MRALAAAAFDWLAFLAMVAAIMALWVALDAPPACAAEADAAFAAARDA